MMVTELGFSHTVLLLFMLLLLAGTLAVLSVKLFALIFLNFFSVIFLGGGGLYVATDEKLVDAMIKLAEVKPGEKAVDLGSGDGRLVIALARAGAEAHGYEINPFLVWYSKRMIKKAGLETKAFIHRKNFWKEDFSLFSIVTLYCISYAMKDLEGKLRQELKPGSRIVSNFFAFPNWKSEKKEGSTSLYTV